MEVALEGPHEHGSYEEVDTQQELGEQNRHAEQSGESARDTDSWVGTSCCLSSLPEFILGSLGAPLRPYNSSHSDVHHPY